MSSDFDSYPKRGLSADSTRNWKSPTFYRFNYATIFAPIGLLWSLISVRAFFKWILSEDFKPAEAAWPPGAMMEGKDIMLVLMQAWSLLIPFIGVLFLVVAPYTARKSAERTGQRVNEDLNHWLDARLMVAGLFCVFTDTYLNYSQYVFAWNNRAVNRGSWARFMPFANPEGPKSAVGILWVPPIYIYFTTFTSLWGAALYGSYKSSYPNLKTPGLFLIVWLAQFITDYLIQMFTLHVFQPYAFAKTYGPLTQQAGSQFQYPLYNSLGVATMCTVYSYVRWEAWQDRKEGLSRVEWGYDTWSKGLQRHVRTFAVIGFCVMNTLVFFTVPVAMLGHWGESKAELPIWLHENWKA